MSGGIPVQLLSFLGACLYGDAPAYYAGLDESECAELDRQARLFGMTPWFYRYLHDVLPEGKREECRKAFQRAQARALSGKYELDRLCGVLRENGLRFALIKGADLAYRLYPDAALRRFNDWDILFHPDDCTRALDVLAADGWCVPDQYMDNPEVVRRLSAHHFSPHVRGGFKVEPHFTLPNFKGVDPHELWAFTREIPGSPGQHVLSPESNLLMLTRHAASNSYFHASPPKLLTDAAMVLTREKPDLAELHAMAARLGLPYPGNLLAAFPEFFPPDVTASLGADSAESARFRALFEMHGTLGDPPGAAIQLNRFRASGNMAGGIWERLRGCGADKMRVVYRLPKHGAWGRLTWAFVRYYCSRTWLWGCAWFRRGDLLDYCRIVDSIEAGAAESAKTAK